MLGISVISERERNREGHRIGKKKTKNSSKHGHKSEISYVWKTHCNKFKKKISLSMKSIKIPFCYKSY